VWQGREVIYSCRWRRVRHILFFVTPLRLLITAKVLQGSMHQPDFNCDFISHERNDSVLFICVVHGGYNMNVWDVTKSLCFVRTVWYRFQCLVVHGINVLCVPSTIGDFHFTARDFMRFPLYHSKLWKFPHYHPLDGKRSLSDASTAIENSTFSAGVTKIVFLQSRLNEIVDSFCSRA